MVDEAGGVNDRIAFVTSSHGSGDGQGNSYLCLLPDPKIGTTPGECAGQYWDHELAADLGGNGQNQSRTMVFVDACFSDILPSYGIIVKEVELCGGLIPELLTTVPRIVGSTTCTRKGYGPVLHFGWKIKP